MSLACLADDGRIDSGQCERGHWPFSQDTVSGNCVRIKLRTLYSFCSVQRFCWGWLGSMNGRICVCRVTRMRRSHCRRPAPSQGPCCFPADIHGQNQLEWTSDPQPNHLSWVAVLPAPATLSRPFPHNNSPSPNPVPQSIPSRGISGDFQWAQRDKIRGPAAIIRPCSYFSSTTRLQKWDTLRVGGGYPIFEGPRRLVVTEALHPLDLAHA